MQFSPYSEYIMSIFQLYFKLGLQHILDIYGVDHILFIFSLCVIFLPKDWRKVLILVTSFTIGHSITLAMVALDVIQVNSKLIEFLIPTTIFITAMSNVFRKKDNFHIYKNIQRNYFFALFFGLVHGMGFANYLGALLPKKDQLVGALLSFNLGIEAGQVIIVTLFLILSYLVVGLVGINRRDYVLVVSAAIAGIALTMMFENKYW